jgi:glycogen debranching enzyme
MTLARVRPDLLYAWNGASLLVTDLRGESGDAHPLSGYYFRETRFLRTLRLDVNDERPWLCEVASINPEALSLVFVHPEIRQMGGGGTGQSGDDESSDEHGLPIRSLDLRVDLHVGIASLTVALEIANRSTRPLPVTLAWSLGADFADLQEAQADTRQQQAPVQVVARAGCVEFTYGHPALKFRTEVHHDDTWRADGAGLTASLSVWPQASQQLRLRVIPVTGYEDLSDRDVRARDSVRQRWRDSFTRVEVPCDRLVERVIASNVRDIGSFALLEGAPDEWLATQAGMPAYPAFFGRDAVTAGWQAGSLDRGASLDAAMVKLGRLQSDRVDDWRDEEPGRIPYQVRGGPLALLNLNPYAAYYADYASPLMLVISLANLWAWTGRKDDLQRHWDTARRILDWARERGDLDQDGYLEYQTRSPQGAKNQGWKDSGDAIVYDDGRPVPSPIATCELQGYWYIAQRLMALMSLVMGSLADAKAHEASASLLKTRFNRDWWIGEQSYYALALDRDKQPIRAVTSNVGHCIACGIIDRARLPAVVGRMFAPDLFSGWGIRTLSTRHAFYNPLSYHRGSVWAVEQATIAFGLRRFGFDARVHDLVRALFDLAVLYPEDRIPECVGGYSRGERSVPGAYPRANTPQLWNATAFPLAVQTLLGLVPLAAAGTLAVDPILPSWMPELVLRDLRVGEATITLRFWRTETGRSEYDVLQRRGTVHVVRQPPPESLTATWTDRLTGALESILPHPLLR